MQMVGMSTIEDVRDDHEATQSPTADFVGSSPKGVWDYGNFRSCQ